MKINKNQALYRALPGSFVNYSDSSKNDYKYSCRVLNWNTKQVKNINEEMIKNDIFRRVNSFICEGGQIDLDLSPENIQNISFVEPAMNEGIEDIVCQIEPTTFYCEKCGRVHYAPNATSNPTCPNCKNIKMKQLGMAYACECGFSKGVVPPTNELLFFNASKGGEQYKFYNSKKQKRELFMICPFCGQKLFPKTSTDHRLFISQSGNIVNLYDDKYAYIISKYKKDAQILVLAKWFGLVTASEFNDILENPKNFFEFVPKDIDQNQAMLLSKQFNIPIDKVIQIMSCKDNSQNSIGAVKEKVDRIYMLDKNKQAIDLIASKLIEFDTLQYPKQLISLEEAISKGKDIGSVIDENDVFALLEKMKIKHIQVSESVQIVNYAYGFTRLRSCPDSSESNQKLKLNGFKNKAYTSIFETEGILVEFDPYLIYQWLIDNEIIKDEEYFETETDIKCWFIEHINLETISHFSTIDGKGDNIVTKVVYSLLHTISHLMILSAGKHCGLSRDSISEIIFPDTCSVFIYPTSIEGVTLGSISGMFESDLQQFLDDSINDNEICSFDPICSTTQNGACVACTYLSEVNCEHFNKDLSRSYVYGGTIKINGEKIHIKKGFWK